MAKSLLNTFVSLDQGTKDALADIISPLLLSLTALNIAKEKSGIETLSAEHITACLEAAGVAIKKLSIIRALSSARGLVSSARDKDGEVFYKLMTKGKREIEAVVGGERLVVVRIDRNQPRTARIKLGEVLSSLKGLVRICDPYYGMRTLDSLDNIPTKTRVRFLTMKTSESGRKLHNALRDFKKERPNVEFRIALKTSGIHDRYVVSKNQLLLLGHGLKDIGGKESFMIRLDRDIVPDLIKETISAFDARWGSSTPL